ncbi:MAG TPA: ABC transporter ATP-binding protein [Candidatus Limnocylindrales bacterium]|nr:ABC transporter ATP-binding protein [Candidatus Limnocylindrales bacterium]
MSGAAPHTADRPSTERPILRVRDLVVHYRTRQGIVHAVNGVSFDLARGETLGVVGESGCGKSTTGRAVIGLPPPTSGTVLFDGVDLTRLGSARLRALRPRMQIVFQDPIASLNPRRSIRDIVATPLRLWNRAAGPEVDRRVDDLLRSVGMDPSVVGDRRPREFSGGQCQRVSIARALALDPDLLICDEPVSALDVSVQAQILNLLEEIRTSRHLAMIFVSHDLGVVKNVSDRIAVMYLGTICELAPTDVLFARPAHPYTATLLAAMPGNDAISHESAGITSTSSASEPPSPIDPPSGCPFRTRCVFAQYRCAQERPVPRQIAPGHEVACHFPLSTAPGDAPADRALVNE